ncbi:MAG: dTMP kinase [Planctomycetota bacterium]
MKNPDRGRFLVLDGPDGSGKSTQALRLVARLAEEGLEPVHTRDPGGTRVGERIREILLDRSHTELDPLTESLLFMASRAQLVTEEIRPALERGRIVVCERWLHSTVCYQGFAGGLDPEEIWRAGETASGGIAPDLALILDVEPSVGLFRLGDEPDLLESRSREFHERVREGYLEIARSGRMGSRLVPASDPDTVAERIWEAVTHVL